MRRRAEVVGAAQPTPTPEVVTRSDGPLDERQIVAYFRSVTHGFDDKSSGLVLLEVLRMHSYDVPITADLIDKVKSKYDAQPTESRSAHTQLAEAGQVVYYARIGNRIKIGTTTHLASRMSTINPEELLATEPGGAAVEGVRHLEFRQYRVNGEWFEDCPAIREHIAGLNK